MTHLLTCEKTEFFCTCSLKKEDIQNRVPCKRQQLTRLKWNQNWIHIYMLQDENVMLHNFRCVIRTSVTLLLYLLLISKSWRWLIKPIHSVGPIRRLLCNLKLDTWDMKIYLQIEWITVSATHTIEFIKQNVKQMWGQEGSISITVNQAKTGWRE